MRKVLLLLIIILIMTGLISCVAVPKDHSFSLAQSPTDSGFDSQSKVKAQTTQKDYEFPKLIVDITMLFFTFVGGGFALVQWHKTTVYKRADVVKSLIEAVRGNSRIATAMDIIDWNEDFLYDGKFTVNRATQRPLLMNLSDDELFKLIDYTLSEFSYICYLYKMKTITNGDMRFFEYGIQRLCGNDSIGDYLYSVYHWSNSLNVKTSFIYIIEYGLKKQYLDKSFKNIDSEYYTCFLEIRSVGTSRRRQVPC